VALFRLLAALPNLLFLCHVFELTSSRQDDGRVCPAVLPSLAEFGNPALRGTQQKERAGYQPRSLGLLDED
jgi:hypothetical protein